MKKTILRLVIPTAICSFMFVPLMSGVLSHTASNEVHATEYEQILFEGYSEFAQIGKDKLPEENPDQIIVEFDGSFDNLIIANSDGDALATISSSDCGKKHFDDSQWELIKNADEVWVNAEAGVPIVKITYLPKGTLHTHGEGSGSFDFYNWDGGAEHNLMPTEEGSYCLTSDIELQSGWAVPSGITNLCLNGHVVKVTTQDCHGIVIESGETLNLYDCGSNVHYFAKDDSGLWTLTSDQSTPTEFSVTGGCITGVNSAEIYNAVCNGGTFNMYGGNIVGNKSLEGAAIHNNSFFNMCGGKIIGNVSTGNGGGIYIAAETRSILTGGEITENAAESGSGICYKEPSCFVAGTQITMADGSKKAIEDLAVGDLVRVYNHNNGTVSVSKLFDVGPMFQQHSSVVNLHFTSDIDLSIVYAHSFFEREENKYVTVTKDNISKYVGHEFYNANSACWEVLSSYDIVDEEVDTYIIASEYNLNCVANDMLSVEDGLYTALLNTFDFGENLKIDANKKASDIDKYGVYGFENIKHVSKHTYEALGLENLNVTFGKGLFSKDQFKYVEMISAELDPEIYCDANEEQPASKSKSKNLRSETPDASSTPNGLYVGGSIKIVNNKNDNLYLPEGEILVVGTGTTGNGNGVPAPTEDMLVGITLENGAGQFASVVGDCASNFFSDSEDYSVRFNNAGTDNDPLDDYLELKAPVAITNATPEDDKAKNNGYIEVAESAIEGDEVSVTVFPNQGYKLSSLKYNDGEKDHDIEDLSFVMPEGEVSVTGTFEEKGEQIITFGTFYHLYNGNPIFITEWYKGAPNNYFKRLGEGTVTIEYKVAGADDSTYTTTAPKDPGNYVVRVSVAEDANYLAGSATKEFEIIEKVVIQKVAFNDIKQPEAGATAQTEVTGMPFGANYSGTLSWSTPIPESGKYECGVTYTATVTLSLNAVGGGLFEFADDVKVVKPSLDTSGWELSDESTSTQLIFTKTFETTAAHDMTHHDAVSPTCTEDGTVEYWSCSRETGVYYGDAQGTTILSTIVDPKLGHDMIYHEAVSPTCTKDGTIAYWTCSHESGVYYTDEDRSETLTTITDPKLGHNIQHYDAKAPTCTEAGWGAYDTCSRCDYTTYVEIPALGHGVSLVAGVDPTYENDGYKPAYKCSVCGEYFEDQAQTKLIGDETAYNAWKANAGRLEKLVKEETGEPAKDNTGLIVGLSLGLFFLLLLIIYLIGYFFWYRKGKLDDKKIRVIYKILPRGKKNLPEEEQEKNETSKQTKNK